MTNASTSHKAAESQLFGLLVEFDSVESLLVAAKKVRKEGFEKWDTHSPIPVHGLDHAMGIKRTRLPLFVLACGLTGLALGVLMQWWMNAYDYPWVISGKPTWSLPANIPVAFETTVLLASLGAVFGMLGFNGLPKFYHALFSSERFTRGASDDKFFISVEASDPQFSLDETKAFAESLGGTHVEVIEEESDCGCDQVRMWVKTAIAVLVCLATVPPVVLARSWFKDQTTTRAQFIPDMDQQPKFKGQAPTDLFADGRAMRPVVEGVVARGEANLETALHQGVVGDRWVEKVPIDVDRKRIEHGQERFGIYCAQCHGLDGYGKGPVSVRAQEIQEFRWVPPTSLHDSRVVDYPDGRLFSVITNGVRNMPAYDDQIDVEDRWAIVAYLRALQRSQNATIGDVPQEKRGELRGDR